MPLPKTSFVKKVLQLCWVFNPPKATVYISSEGSPLFVSIAEEDASMTKEITDRVIDGPDSDVAVVSSRSEVAVYSEDRAIFVSIPLQIRY